MADIARNALAPDDEGPGVDHSFEAALAQARKDRIPVMALREDSTGLDDVVVETPRMFRAEMMSDKNLWLCCYFDNGERVTFSVYSRRGPLEFTLGETPAEWRDWDKLRRVA